MSVRVRPSAPASARMVNAELCSGSTGDFGSLSPGSNPGSAASIWLERRALVIEDAGRYNLLVGYFPDSSTVERAAVNR